MKKTHTDVDNKRLEDELLALKRQNKKLSQELEKANSKTKELKSELKKKVVPIKELNKEQEQLLSSLLNDTDTLNLLSD